MRITIQIRIYTVQINVRCIRKRRFVDLAPSSNDDLIRPARLGQAAGLLKSPRKI